VNEGESRPVAGKCEAILATAFFGEEEPGNVVTSVSTEVGPTTSDEAGHVHESKQASVGWATYSRFPRVSRRNTARLVRITGRGQ
jgi:hypothetical protein